MSIHRFYSCLLAVSFVCVSTVVCSHVVAQEQTSPAVETVESAKKEPAKQDEDATEAIAMRLQLELLQVRRKRLGLNFGDAHPTMLRLDDEIKSLQKKLEAAASPKDLLQRSDPESLKSMNEEELRTLVGELVKRVLVLEKEVHGLKESPTISRRFPR